MSLVDGFQVATPGGMCLYMFCFLIWKWEKYLSCKKAKKLNALSAFGQGMHSSISGPLPVFVTCLPLKAFVVQSSHKSFEEQYNELGRWEILSLSNIFTRLSF